MTSSITLTPWRTLSIKHGSKHDRSVDGAETDRLDHSGAEHLSDVMFYLLVHEETEV